MPVLRRFWLLLIAAGLVVVSVLVTWAVVGSSTPSPTSTTGTGYVSGTGVVPGRGTTGTSSGNAGGAYPAYCCTSGNVPGLTTTGQASVYGYGPAARADAIARAVADANDQAVAAAKAAGFRLVGVISMQVSAPANYPYPMGAASGGAAGTPRSAVPPGASGAPVPPTASAVPPVPAAGAGGAAPKANGSSTAKGSSAIACVYGEPCPDYGYYSTSASVTITWALG